MEEATRNQKAENRGQKGREIDRQGKRKSLLVFQCNTLLIKVGFVFAIKTYKRKKGGVFIHKLSLASMPNCQLPTTQTKTLIASPPLAEAPKE